MTNKFVLASNNDHKLREFREIFLSLGLEVLSLFEAGVNVDPNENGTTFAENAMIKARAVYDLCRLPTVADDSGLCVNALKGEPGVFSARYGGQPDDAARRKYLMHKLDQAGTADRSAYFVSAIACIIDDETNFVVEGRCNGVITTKEAGENGFGYDSMFSPLEYPNQTFAEISAEEKNGISHRGRALENFADKIKQIWGE